MTELLQSATHDQIAVGFCCLALLVCGAIMHFSVHLGRLTGRNRLSETLSPGRVSVNRPQKIHTRQKGEFKTRDRAA